MRSYTDQCGQQLFINQVPKRIVSLVPSQSEFLWDLGLRSELVGITRFCVHPQDMFKTISRVGGTKQLDLDKIRRLQPDLIIGNKEENEKLQIEILQKEFPVWLSDIYTFEDAFDMMQRLAQILDKTEEAAAITDKLRASLAEIYLRFQNKKLAYFIWNKPYMCAAKHTFIDHVLQYLGFENAFAGWERYPEIPEEELKKANPELCFLSSEPFPFKEQHVLSLQKILPESKICIVDGEVFSWYGSRLLHLEAYVKRRLMHELTEFVKK